MAPQIDNKLRRLIQPLRALGFVLKGIPRGIRIKFEKGPDVDIYTLKSNSSHIRARIKTQVADETVRERMVETIERQIADSLYSVAELHDFRLTKDSDGVYVYYAHLDMFGEAELAPDSPKSDQPDEEDRQALEATEALLDKALFEDDAEDEAAPGEDGLGQGENGQGENGEGGNGEALAGENLSAANDAAGAATGAQQAADDIPPGNIFIDDSLVETFLEEGAGGPEPEPAAEAETEKETGKEADAEGPSDAAGGSEIDFSAYMEEVEADDTEAAAPPTTQAVVDQLEAVDAKMLRQAMDSLSLPRSSNVRLVLTRLYRSAVDPEELNDSVRREAAKISTDEDRETLKMLREVQSVNFLNPLIDLLYHTVEQA